MVKILSQGGRSLADMYDVVGSVAGIEQLESREVTLVHEMGATLFSERFRTTFRRAQSGDVAQSTDINLAIANMPEGVSRLLGVQVVSDDASRIANAQVSIADQTAGQEFPVWSFSGNSSVIRLQHDSVVTTLDLLLPDPGLTLPAFITVGQANLEMNELRLRATTTAFGAGTVLLDWLLNFAFTFTGGVSAFGAQVPSW